MAQCSWRRSDDEDPTQQQSHASTTRVLVLNDQLPQVLQDAIELTQYIGERYLWCDALCTVQDDADLNHSQIALMGIIYGRAFLIICGLSSDNASVGLFRFSQSSPAGLPFGEVRFTKKHAYMAAPVSLDAI